MCYVPFPTNESAQKVVGHLLENKLIACANIVQSVSMYNWQDTFHQEDEWIAIIKTVQSKQQILIETVQSHHPYDLPAILCWEIEANKAYGEWVNDQVMD